MDDVVGGRRDEFRVGHFGYFLPVTATRKPKGIKRRITVLAQRGVRRQFAVHDSDGPDNRASAATSTQAETAVTLLFRGRGFAHLFLKYLTLAYMLNTTLATGYCC